MAKAEKSGKKTCLLLTCRKAMEKCGHDEYLVCMEELSLKEAKTKYPEVAFCEDWENKNG